VLPKYSPRVPAAASLIREAAACGWQTYREWLAATSVTDEPARFDIGLRTGSRVSRIGPDSLWFREFPVFAKAGMQFESHLGHGVPAGQRLIVSLLLIELDFWKSSDFHNAPLLEVWHCANDAHPGQPPAGRAICLAPGRCSRWLQRCPAICSSQVLRGMSGTELVMLSSSEGHFTP
jgi:hypothetical protein